MYRLLVTILGVAVGVLGCARGYANEPITLKCDELTESSGLATSLQLPQCIWTHNDSGGKPRIYLFNSASGVHLATAELPESPVSDWEDICSFSSNGKNYLAIADTGDNARRRKQIEIIVFEEPSLAEIIVDSALGSPARTIQLHNYFTLKTAYPNGSTDCEALAFDPQNSKFLLLTKELLSCHVFSIEVDLARLNNQQSVVIDVPMKPVQTLPVTMVTGACICPKTRRLAVCNYNAAYLFQPSREGWDADTDRMQKVALPRRKQGEAICFFGSAKIAVTSEIAPTPFWLVDLVPSNK